MKKYSSLTKLTELLPKVFNKFAITETVQAAQVVNHWKEVAEPIIGSAQVGTALYLKKKVLTIAVTNSALSQTIQMHKSELLEGLNKFYAPARVADIRTKQQ